MKCAYWAAAVVVILMRFVASFPAAAKTRTYYLAADIVDWDYAPAPTDVITGAPLPSPPPSMMFKQFVKVIYREYTDATFATLKQRPPRWQHLGALGPVIRAEVGDTIRVVFKNHADRPFSVHPHGVFYHKDSEGAPYADATSGADKSDDAVPPGGTHTYVWQVPERAGPGPSDPNSIVWMYHSHVEEHKDIASGLIGPIIISAKGTMQANGMPKGVDREFVTMFALVDENASWYLDQSIKKFVPSPAAVNKKDPDFQDSALIPAINGRAVGNLPMMTMRRGEHVRWYVLADATQDGDFHVAHWHGQTVLENGMRVDTVEVLPMGMKVVDMVPDNLGIWLFHCHVPGHAAFMSARFTVMP